MAKKSFISGITKLFNENLKDIHELSGENLKKVDLNKITDEQLKWLIIKLSRYEKELYFWRTGKLTPEIFEKTLKEFNLKYNSQTNSFELSD